VNILLWEASLENGLTVRIFDNSRCYYGDYHRVILKICCEVRLIPEYFADTVLFNKARGVYGDTIVHDRQVEQMAVPSAEVPMVKENLIAYFMKHSLPYLSASAFPKKLSLSELCKNKRGRCPTHALNLHE
jgi:hypothetical protein